MSKAVTTRGALVTTLPLVTSLRGDDASLVTKGATALLFVTGLFVTGSFVTAFFVTPHPPRSGR